jgi:hypothetical protein
MALGIQAEFILTRKLNRRKAFAARKRYLLNSMDCYINDPVYSDEIQSGSERVAPYAYGACNIDKLKSWEEVAEVYELIV